jgi:hypothetical protein
VVVRDVNAVGQAGGLLLVETITAAGLDRHLSTALEPWRKPLATHDPAKVLLDLAMSLVLGGDGLNDTAVLRAEPGIYGEVASLPTISRLIATLAGDVKAASAAITAARAAARERVWRLAGAAAPNAAISSKAPLVIDIDATIIRSHSDKEKATGTFKRTFGLHPLTAFVDHGAAGTGEPLAIMLRPGNAGSNTVIDHVEVLRQALAGIPVNASKSVLIRTDGAGGTKEFIRALTRKRLQYSLGFTLPDGFEAIYHQVPDSVWAAAYNADGLPREGAAVAEFTDLLDLGDYPPGMRVIVRRERPHPGAQLRFEDVDGYRLTAFATNAARGQLADLEVRHRQRARIEDRIRIGKDSGLSKLPLQGFAANQIWCHIVQLALDLTAWMQMIALTSHDARRWEPGTLRLRLFTIPATITRRARQRHLNLAKRAPWADLVLTAITALRELDPAPR